MALNNPSPDVPFGLTLKAWAVVTLAGIGVGASVIVAGKSQGIASALRTANGNFDVLFSSNMDSTFYVARVVGEAGNASPLTIEVTARAVGGCHLRTLATGATDIVAAYIAFYE